MLPKLLQHWFLMMPTLGSHDDKMMLKKPTKIRHKERPKKLKTIIDLISLSGGLINLFGGGISMIDGLISLISDLSSINGVLIILICLKQLNW